MYLIHERADEEQPAATNSAEVVGVPRIRQGGPIEAGPLIPDAEYSLGTGQPEREMHHTLPIRRLPTPFIGQLVIVLFVFLSQLRTRFQVPVENGVYQRFLQGYA